MSKSPNTSVYVSLITLAVSPFVFADVQDPRVGPADPGSRTGALNAGGPIAGLTIQELAVFNLAQATFLETDSVSGTLTAGSGLGPRFNMDNCAGCHAFPAT